MARNTNKAATPATATKAPRALRAAAIVAQHGLAALPRIALVTVPAAASVKRYAAGINALTPAFAARVFTPTPLGKAAIAASGCIGKAGQATAMGLTAVAMGNAMAANGGAPANGAAIVAAIIGNPQLMAAMLGTKAQGTHILPNSPAAAKWAQGYVNGLCRPQHGLAA